MKTRIALSLALLAAMTGCSKKAGPTAPKPTPPTKVVVQSTPNGARIAVDGVVRDVWTPGAFDLPPGSHAVGLTALGYRDTSLTISPTGAPTETLKVVLGPHPGTPRTFGVWKVLADSPIGLATSASGPVFVTTRGGTGTLLSFATDGALLGQASLNFDYASNLAATASGHVYFARYSALAVNALVERHASDAHFVRTIYFGGGFFTFPLPPCPAIGTNDTLLVLERSNSQVCRYTNDTFAALWNMSRSFSKMAVDPASRRCYFMGASDTVFVFSTGGQTLGSWRVGLDPYSSYYITVAPDGTVYAADAFTIHHFTASGTPIGAWLVGSVGGVSGIAVDGVGSVYVAGFGSANIVRYVP